MNKINLTGNVNMIEKLVMGGTGGPPDPQPDVLTSAPLRYETGKRWLDIFVPLVRWNQTIPNKFSTQYDGATMC